jgi:lipid-A-disaccharide synthase
MVSPGIETFHPDEMLEYWSIGKLKTPPSKKVLIVAGEASADLHGSNLVRAMKRLDLEVFSKLHAISKAYFRLKNLLNNARPDLLILIDYPDFNLRLARIAKQYRIPVLYYISPQVWAWRIGRIKKITRRVDRMAVILPFEEAFYRKRGVDVEYVGHPILDSIPHHLNRGEAIKELGLRNDDMIIGLLPGSRREEIGNLLPPMIKTAEILSDRYKHLECVLPVASTISPELIQSTIGQSSVSIKAFQGNIYKILTACDLVLVTSGTATLEAAIMGVPMVIVYRVSPITYWVGKKIIRVPYIGLANLVAGEKVVPELIQDEITPDRLAQEACAILEGGQKRENMIEKLKLVRKRMGGAGASERTARIAMEMMI